MTKLLIKPGSVFVVSRISGLTFQSQTKIAHGAGSIVELLTAITAQSQGIAIIRKLRNEALAEGKGTFKFGHSHKTIGSADVEAHIGGLYFNSPFISSNGLFVLTDSVLGRSQIADLIRFKFSAQK